MHVRLRALLLPAAISTVLLVIGLLGSSALTHGGADGCRRPPGTGGRAGTSRRAGTGRPQRPLEAAALRVPA
jgi:hypothetical protein